MFIIFTLFLECVNEYFILEKFISGACGIKKTESLCFEVLLVPILSID